MCFFFDAQILAAYKGSMPAHDVIYPPAVTIFTGPTEGKELYYVCAEDDERRAVSPAPRRPSKNPKPPRAPRNAAKRASPDAPRKSSDDTGKAQRKRRVRSKE